MFYFGYFKGRPGEYVLQHVGGQVVREGVGISFLYFKPTTSISLVPVTTLDANFIFNETTRTFQAVTIQGQLTWRVKEPKVAAGLLNFTVRPETRAYASNDPEQLPKRIINVVRTYARAEVGQLGLEETLLRSEAIARQVAGSLKGDAVLAAMGVEVLDLYFLSVAPTPEMAKALEADFREALQRKSDQAIYARRAAAVEQERKIKENELATDIALEERRKGLLDLKASNAELEAETDANGAEIRLRPFKEVAPATLLALALRDLGANAGKIGNLTVTTELLAEVLRRAK